MDRALALVLVLASGFVIAFQAPANLGLAQHIGTIRAAFISFAVGAVILAAIGLVATGGLSIGVDRDRTWWHYLGGFAGVFLVVILIVALPPLGATLEVAMVVAGQAAGSVLIDRFGLLGVPARAIGPAHITGLALIGIGVAVVTRA